MNWLNSLERKYHSYALEGLIRYISFLMLTVFFLNQSGMLSYNMLYLHRDAILSGQVWRLFTFLLIPKSTNFLFLIFELSILVMCADGLESRWGTFKLTAYYLTGALANIAAAMIMPEIQFGSYFIYLSLFLGFATIYPDYEILIFLILPVKVKYLAMISGGYMLYYMAIAPVYIKLAIGLAVGNYLLFFFNEIVTTIKHNRNQAIRSAEYAKAAAPEKEYRHKCSVCGETDVSNPELNFRYCTCRSCGPNGVAFCNTHLAEHKENSENSSP